MTNFLLLVASLVLGAPSALLSPLSYNSPRVCTNSQELPESIPATFPGLNGLVIVSKRVVVGDTTLAFIRLTNIGEVDIQLDSLTHPPGGAPYPTIFARFIKDSTNILVPSKDSVDIPLQLIASAEGTFQLLLVASGMGKSVDFYYWDRAFPRTPYWQDLYNLVIGGCESNMLIDIPIYNFGPETAKVDSISINTPGWYLPDVPTDLTIPSDTSIKISILRTKGTLTPGVAILYPHGAKPDTLTLPVYFSGYEPRVLPEVDTVYIDIPLNTSKIAVLTAKNTGHGTFHLLPAQYTPVDEWIVEPIDTTQDILVSATAQIFLHFAAQSLEGDYPITITIRPDVCDTAMTKTVIARVRKPSGVAEAPKFEINLWPQPSTDHLYIDCSVEFRYELFDLLGTSVQRGSAPGGQNRIDLSGLHTGRYILRTSAGNVVRSQSISIVR